MASNLTSQHNEICVDSIAKPIKDEKPSFLLTAPTLLGIICLLSGALLGSYSTMILIECKQTCDNIPDDDSISDSHIFKNETTSYRIVSRKEWVAQPPEHELMKLSLPSERVIIAHTATENCTTQASCTYQVRLIQTFHIESRRWDDIAYNFLVGGDGFVYIGRGWDFQGAHTRGYNVKSICIAFIGTFNKVVPPKRQLQAAQELLNDGIKTNKLSIEYALYFHRQLIASESRGLALYNIIMQWDHWAEDVY